MPLHDAIAYANELSKLAKLTPCYVLTDIVCWDDTNVGTDVMGCMNSKQKSIVSMTIALNGVSSTYDCHGYRLPTEGEWEYAVRAGSNSAFYPSEGNDGSITYLEDDPNMNQIGWTYPLSEGKAQPVALKEVNDWGLCDMSGNVAEWTSDINTDSHPSGDTMNPIVDPESSSTVDYEVRVIRGGFFTLPASFSRSARRFPASPRSRASFIGFRLVRTIKQ